MDMSISKFPALISGTTTPINRLHFRYWANRFGRCDIQKQADPDQERPLFKAVGVSATITPEGSQGSPFLTFDIQKQIWKIHR